MSINELKRKILVEQTGVEEMYQGIKLDKSSGKKNRKAPPLKKGTFVVYGQSNKLKMAQNRAIKETVYS